MARSGGLLGGGGNSPLDIYGDLFNDEQKQALQQRELSSGLLRFAEKLGAASAPSRAPKGSFLGILGQSLGGLAPTGEGEERVLKGMEVAEKVRSARAERAILAKAAPMVEAIANRLIQAGVPAAQANQIATQAASGGPTGAPLANNAPPPPPPTPDLAGVALDSYGLPRQDLSRYGLPTRPGAPPMLSPDAAPGPQTSLLPPPPGATPQMGAAPGTLSASLYGGTPSTLPFNMADANPPGAAGGLPDLGQIQVELLSGKAAPASDVEMPFPTLQDPNKPRSAWQQGYTYDQPKVPYGQDPSDRVRPGGRLDDARLDALTRQYESGDRNIMQQVNATSTSGGYYQINNPTWRDIAARAGIDLEKYPTAISAPREVQAAAAKALRETRGMQPWASNKPLMAAIGGNLPDVGRVRIDPLGGEAAPAGQGGIAGTGVSPEELAALNAMLKMGGLKSDPFGSLLETYYKSPGYLAEKARTEAKATKDVALEMDPLIAKQTETAKAKVEFEWKPKIEEAVQKLQSPILDERNKAKADIDRYSKELEIDQTAAKTITKATVFGPDGVLGTQDMTASEFSRRQKALADRVAKGNTTLQPGDIVPTPTGNLPPGYQHRMTPEGTLVTGAMPNTPAAREEAAATEKDRLAKAQRQTSTDFVVTDVNRIREKVMASPRTTTGTIGGWMSALDETEAGEVKNLVEGIEANIMLDRMLALKAASPTGATGLGSQTQQEGERLVKAYGSLKQSQGTEQFLYNLDRVQRLYLEFVHGPVVAQQMMANRPAPTTPSKSTAIAGGGATAPIPPPVGTVRDGYEFTGGDPSRQNSWRKVP